MTKETQQAPPATSFWRQHDLNVLLFVLAVFAGGTLATRQLATPKSIPFHKVGLRFERPAGWLPGQEATTQTAGLASTAAGFGVNKAKASPGESSHIIYRSARDARQRIEVRVGPRPSYRNLRGARAIDRLGQYGEFYWEAESDDFVISDRKWVRSEFRYAFKPSKSGSPQIANAVEYATIQDSHLYVVTLHGDQRSMDELDKSLSPTLLVEPSVAAGGSPK